MNFLVVWIEHSPAGLGSENAEAGEGRFELDKSGLHSLNRGLPTVLWQRATLIMVGWLAGRTLNNNDNNTLYT